MKYLAGIFAALAALAWSAHSRAQASPQNYPLKPVTLYVGFPAGSTNDSTARTMAHQLTETLGQQFVVINRDGMAGVMAAATVAKMKPDGYSLLWGSSSPLASSPAYNRNVPYDPLKDFAPISVYFYIPFVVVVHPSVPALNLKALIALARSQPGKLSFGSSGVGGALHLATELMLNMSGTKMVHIPYRGTPAMMLDLISGQIDLATTSTSLAAPHIQRGRLRAIGVTSRQRSAQLPNVPTISEAGLPDYELVGWYSMLAPAGTPRDIIMTLNTHFLKALEHPSVKASIAAEGALPGGNTPEQFSAFIRSELEKYTKLVKDARLTPGS
ncbi:MAG TPA: tripartite tricarboxylate transporter substrate binding protein [Burkholderiales bacterium]|nr:tripartite tricarboxylate transporter substrate binding protein [Burkholderiales bacterium]